MADPTPPEAPHAATAPLAGSPSEWLELPTVPSVGRSYLRALAGTFTKKTAAAKALSVTVPPRTLDVAHLERYRRVTGFSDPGAVPPTYLHALAVPLHLALITHPAFPARALGLIHTEQHIDVLGDLDPSRPLGLAARVGRASPARRGASFQLETTATAQGAVVWRGLTTFLAPGYKAPTSPDSTTATAAATEDSDGGTEPTPVAAPAPASSAGAPGEGAEVEVSLLWPLPAGLGRQYARVGGDYNPIHMSAISARLFGFRRAIVHGMWSMARALAAVEDLGPRGPRRYAVRFRRPIFLPSEVRFTATRLGDGLAMELTSARTGKLHLEGTVEPL